MATNRLLARKHSTLQARARIIQEIRRFFVEGGYLEVETPLRIPAPAPESHIDPVISGNWFLHTSPELCMKRMMAAGYERLFQICHCWRDGERGKMHLPEFTMLEWYRAYTDYFGLMEECEELIRLLADAIGKGDSVLYRDRRIELAPQWERLTVREAFRRYCRVSMEEALESDLFDEYMVRDIEPMLGIETPTFIHDYPASRAALASLKKDDPSVAERFELYIGGIELANAFSELIDPDEQSARFAHESDYRLSQNKLTFPLPEKFLSELSDMPNSAGIALGLDRLVMVLLNADSVDDVVSFTPEEL